MQQLSSLDFWTFIVALLAFIATVWYGRKEIRLAEEQLTLTRKEAEHRPVLAVSAMDLINPVEVDAVVETAQESKKAQERAAQHEFEIRQYEKKRKEKEQERRKYPFAAFDYNTPIRPQDPNLIYPYYNYEGPYPDWVLRVTVVNKGRTAALNVSGQLYFDAAQLEPFDFPGLNGNVEAQDDGTHQVSVYAGEGSRLLPAPTDEEMTFDIAVLVKQPGTTSIRYAFATPQGDHVEDIWSLDVPAPRQ